MVGVLADPEGCNPFEKWALELIAEGSMLSMMVESGGGVGLYVPVS